MKIKYILISISHYDKSNHKIDGHIKLKPCFKGKFPETRFNIFSNDKFKYVSFEFSGMYEIVKSDGLEISYPDEMNRLHLVLHIIDKKFNMDNLSINYDFVYE